MTPGARAAAAIGVLDRVLAGEPAEKVLTNWGRASRFAGSGDRAAVRDLVFDALRRRSSAAALGGGLTGRGLVLGLVRRAGQEGLFSGEGHAPRPPTPEESGREPTDAEALDVPDWLLPAFAESLGADCAPVLEALRQRAPVFLGVNLGKTDRAAAMAALADEGIAAVPHALADTALEVTGGARKLAGSAAYRTGLVELQDVSSQAVVAALPLADGMRVLDHCAGGGGKALAMAARARLDLRAHDILPRRMADLPERARRAGAEIALTDRPGAGAPYDLVLVDAPCSGSGSWRRDPEGKWRLTPARLAELQDIQAGILAEVEPWVARGGWLAYATCSLLNAENLGQVRRFLGAQPGWALLDERRFSPISGGDGFYLAVMRRD